MRIAQVLQSDSWGDISPEAFERGIGGREGALIRLSKEWADMGHEVTNFVPIKKSQRFDEVNQYRQSIGFHEYVSINLSQGMLRSFPYDAVVAWECPSVFAHDDILEKQKVRLTHLQVAHFNMGEEEAAERFSTGIVALSEWAKDFLVASGLNHKKLYVRPNGVDISAYPLKQALNKPKGQRFVYSSSPDRGLNHLLNMWPQIRSEWPKATLFVAYGAENYAQQLKWSHSRIGEMSVSILEGLKQPGVVDLGKIGQKQLAELQMNSTAWLYPADTIQATETGCITAIENMAACNPCVMTDADCLEDEFSQVSAISKLPFGTDDFLRQMFYLLETPQQYEEVQKKGREFAEARDWSKIAPTWLDLFKEQNG